MAGEYAGDLSPGEKAAVPVLVAWSKRDEAKWRRDGEWVLHWRTRGLQRPHRSQHRSLDVALGEARKLPKWCQLGEGRMFTRVTYRDLDPATGLDPYGDDTRERLLVIERQANEGQARERGLRGRAVGAARKETGDVTNAEAISGFVSLVNWLLGRGERPARQEDAA